MKKQNNTEYKRRTPIVLNKNAVALIHIFSKHDRLDDMWIIDTDWMSNHQNYRESAKEFLDQLEGEYCDLFLEQLALECISRYKANRLKCGCKNHVDDLRELLINELK